MLSVKENERLTRVGPGTPMGALLREQMAITEAGKDPMNVFRDPAQNTILHIPTEHGLVETARARRLSRKAEEALQERGRIPRGIWTKPSGLCAGQTQGLPETPSTCSLSPRLRRFRLLRRAPIRTVPGIVEFCETPGCVFGVSGWS